MSFFLKKIFFIFIFIFIFFFTLGILLGHQLVATTVDDKRNLGFGKRKRRTERKESKSVRGRGKSGKVATAANSILRLERTACLAWLSLFVMWSS